jgi:rod shape-determining protein MreC
VENSQLRSLMGLGARLIWGFIPAEALHSTAAIPSEELVTTVTLTAGSNVGIKKFSPVVAPEGLVGQVMTADPTTSIAMLYSHPDFRASAMTAAGNAFGIVYPASSRKGADVYMLELRGVPARDTVVPGTLIVTAGLGGVFPRGVTIGTVVQAMATNEVWTHTYLVKPAVNPSRVTSVFMLTAQRVTEGTGNVWSAGTANVDATLKRIAGAGDSLAKQAAVIEAAARRATLDSVKRAAIDSVRKALGVPEAGAVAAPAVPGAPTTATPPRPAPTTTARPAPAPTTDTAALRIRRDSLRADSLRRAGARPPVPPVRP